MKNHYKVIDEEQVKNKKIIMRVDFNVPMKGGKIVDDTRIRRVIPGLKILANSAKQIFLITHFFVIVFKIGTPFSIELTKCFVIFLFTVTSYSFS